MSANAERIRVLQSEHHDRFKVPDPQRIRKAIRWLDRCFPALGGMLDVGYATGSFADLLATRGWKCTGLDINPHDGSIVKTIQCDLNEGFPVEAEAYELVTAGEVIEHMVDEGAFLDECRRVLKPGGLLLVTTPNLSYLLNRVLVPLGKLPLFVYAPYHYHFHTRKTIVRLLQEHGFSIEKVTSSHILYSRRRHWTGWVFEWLGDLFPTFGAHLIVFARKP